jgi:2-polyprenyl-3-methyl-5-hydroxy-6-metoxy-1,4-benzoquinol methylase
MRIGDYFIQQWRMKKASQWIQNGSRVFDVGCHQGEFLEALGEKINPSVGVDPLYKKNEVTRHQLSSDLFKEGMPFDKGTFDAVVLLATIEHIHDKSVIARESARLLRPGGRVIITVPSIFVDKILEVLLFLRFVDGMSLEEHHQFNPDELPNIFKPEGFLLEKKQKFQFGLNNLFVFKRL